MSKKYNRFKSNYAFHTVILFSQVLKLENQKLENKSSNAT